MSVIGTQEQSSGEETKQVNVRLPVSLIEEVREAGKRDLRNFQSQVQHFLKQGLARHKGTDAI